MLSLISTYINPALATAPSVPLQEQTPAEIVNHFSQLYGSDYDLVMSVISCESNFKMVPGDGGKSFGVAQYNKDTFKRHSEALGEVLTYESMFDQLKLISFAYGHSEAYKNEWTTYRAIKNGGTYTFTDRYGKTHTARCSLRDWE